MTNVKILEVSQRGSKLAAEQNLKNKIAILETWLQQGIPWKRIGDQICRDNDGARIPIYIPNSLRSFNKWNSSCYSEDTKVDIIELASISGNGTDTLNNYPSIKERALSLLIKVNEALNVQIDREGSRMVKQLELEIARLNLFIKNQTSKITELHRDNLNLVKYISVIEKREKGNFDELRNNYSAVERQNSALREQIALLTKQMKNIHMLRDINREG